MKGKNNTILRVAVATPLRRLFDYLPAKHTDLEKLSPGIRISVPFGRRKNVIGIIMEITDHSDYPNDKLRRILNVIDQQPVLDNSLLKLINWTSRYYHHPVGEVVFNALPVRLRTDNTVEKLNLTAWQLTKEGQNIDPNSLKRAPRQAQLINHLQQHSVCSEAELLSIFPGSKPIINKLVEKGWLSKTIVKPDIHETDIKSSDIKLNKDQELAVKQIISSIDDNPVYLLDGLTGSGKTEVYLSAIEHVLKQGKQCLVLLPEIGLTPQVIQRFQERFDCPIAIQHSGLSELERARYWMDAREGRASIVLGTRSAVWTPLAKPGLFIIDEEHDPSYKQQDGLRYSARDTLIMRAQNENVPVILGSATPSLESLCNVEKNRYQHLILKERAGNAKLPDYKLVDIRGKKMHGAISQTLIDEMHTHLANNNQVLLFLNRRGYANNLFCHGCGWQAMCERCDIPFTFHKARNKLICHHCDSQRRSNETCPECGDTLTLIGHGTERIEEVLHAQFPDHEVIRIDRDTTRKKQAFDQLLKQIQNGSRQILVGTQMLAKGHHFPNVTLTAIIDADRGLFSTDFRASERLAQLFIQVSGRTGRGNKPGTVLVQSHHPEHPLFQQLITKGYADYASSLLQERKLATLPPYSYLALLTAEAHAINDTQCFLHEAAASLKSITDNQISVFGPIPALIEKRSGRYRWQIMLQASNRKSLHQKLDAWLLQLETMKLSKKVRWALDIDPVDMA